MGVTSDVTSSREGTCVLYEPAAVVGAELPEHVLGIGHPHREQLATTDEGRVAKGTFEKDAGAEVAILLDPGTLLRIRRQCSILATEGAARLAASVHIRALES